MGSCISTQGQPKSYTTKLVSKDSKGNVEVDTFDDIKSKLTQPTKQTKITSIKDGTRDEDIILWRGTTNAACTKMLMGKSVSGSSDFTVTAPTKNEAQAQVAYGAKLPEFTTQIGVAEGFSIGRFLVVVRINTRYLTKGSGTEGG